MNDYFYQKLLKESPIGFAYHRIICDAEGIPCDYEFLEVNEAFEAFTGLKSKVIIGEKITDVIPDIKKDKFDWIGFYGNVALRGQEEEFEQHSEALNKYYKVRVSSPEKYYFVTWFTDITEERIWALELELMKNRYRNIIEGSNIGTWELNAQTGEETINERWAGMLGYAIKELAPITDRTWLENIHPDDLISVQKETKQLHKNIKEQYDIDFRMKHKDGHWVWVNSKGSGNSWTEEGTPLMTSGTHTDITDRVKAEKMLLQSEEKFRILFDKAPLGYQSLDINGCFIDVNAQWLDMLGYNREEVIGKWFGDFLSPIYQDGFRKRFPVFKAQGYIHSEFEMVHKNGAKLFIAFDGKIGYDKEGEFKQTHCILKDITIQQQLELELDNEKKLLEATLRSVGDGVISCDKNGHILFLNPVAENLTGWMLEEAEGKPIEQVFNIFDESTGEKSLNIAEKVIKSGRIQELENHTILISANGIKRPIEDSAAPIIQDNGENAGAVIVFKDISEKLKKIEEIRFLSYHDYLTGLYNRRFFEEELNRYNTSRNLPMTIVMADVNGLKLINDSFGHEIGDKLLRTAAKVISEGCRSDDIVARLGGDEFVIILPKTDSIEAEKLIDRIQNKLLGYSVGNILLSISFGYETKIDEGQDIRNLLKQAEDHMYRHKLYESASMRNQTINLIMNTLYEKNMREMNHSKRVGDLCESLAKQLEYSWNDVKQIKIAGLMHDIGKIGISDNILNKSEKLDEHEWEEIKKHSEIGYRILSSVNEFSEVAEYVLQHQEKWDGTGYPKGLKNEEISVPGRIIAIVDSFDAMTGERAYGRLMSEIEAADEIKKCAGTQFDPEIAKVFVEKILMKSW